MPSWEPASRTDSSEALRSAARAARLCGAASSRRDRRAAIRANSTATKNALAAIKPTVTTSTTHGLFMGNDLVVGCVVCEVDGQEHRGWHAVIDGANVGPQNALGGSHPVGKI